MSRLTVVIAVITIVRNRPQPLCPPKNLQEQGWPRDHDADKRPCWRVNPDEVSVAQPSQVGMLQPPHLCCKQRLAALKFPGRI